MAAKVSIAPSRKIISAAEINEHFQNDKNLDWVPLKHLMGDVCEQCVDGRSQKGVIGTPGGNMGEFILSLDAAEKVTGITLRENEINALFDHYLDTFGAFYMHTDTHALQHALHDKALNKFEINSVKKLEAAIKNPEKKLQPLLLKLLTDPQNIGCGHIKLMLIHPDEYGVRPELITIAIQSFYKALWAGKKLEFVVLNADHAESAVVTVMVEDKELTDTTAIPTVASMGDHHQMFVNHPQAITFMRQTMAKEIVSKKLIYGLTSKHLNTYLNTMIDRGNHLTRLTLSYLALGLPHYTVTVSPS